MVALRVATPWPKHAEAAVPKNPVRKSLREVSNVGGFQNAVVPEQLIVWGIDSPLQYEK